MTSYNYTIYKKIADTYIKNLNRNFVYPVFEKKNDLVSCNLSILGDHIQIHFENENCKDLTDLEKSKLEFSLNYFINEENTQSSDKLINWTIANIVFDNWKKAFKDQFPHLKFLLVLSYQNNVAEAIIRYHQIRNETDELMFYPAEIYFEEPTIFTNPKRVEIIG